MSKMFADVQPAVRKETKKVAIGTFVCVVLMFQLIWGVLAIAVPCFQFVAGILPLLFPNIVIKTVGIIGGRKAA